MKMKRTIAMWIAAQIGAVFALLLVFGVQLAIAIPCDQSQSVTCIGTGCELEFGSLYACCNTLPGVCCQRACRYIDCGECEGSGNIASTGIELGLPCEDGYCWGEL